MIVYHTSPVRCFPLLVECIVEHFSHPYHFRLPIRARSKEEHRLGMLSGLIPYDYALAELPRSSAPGNRFPSDMLRNGIDLVENRKLQPIDFLYGIFDGRLIKKRDDDFVFTIISHPGRHVYDVFKYLSYACSTTPIEIQRAEGLIHFQPIVREGIENFVERVLANDLEIKIDGIVYDLIVDMFRFNFQVQYDFIGIEEHIEQDVDILSERLGISIAPTPKLLARQSSIVSREHYRFEDVCAVLSKEVAFYEEHRTRRIRKLMP